VTGGWLDAVDAPEAMGVLDAAAVAAAAGDEEPAAAALEELTDELVARFAVEEALMRDRRYPDRAGHAAAHAAFLQALDAVRHELMCHGPTSEIRQWLALRGGAWLRTHARTADVPLAGWLVASGGGAR
jgi:hemerythrin